MRLLVAGEPIDFRAGIDGLAGACRKRLEADPFSGCLFVFRNRARTVIKFLCYDGQGV
jgi:transposase